MSKESSPKYLRDSKCLKFLKNSSKNTKKSYLQAIRKYEAFYGMTIEELVLEALDEQTRQVPPHLLKVMIGLKIFKII